MERKALAKIIDDVFSPAGFKRKGNHWVDNRGEIVKLINLQKSNFGEKYYINYGYNLKNLLLEGLAMHVYFRLASMDAQERSLIKRLLDQENELPDDERGPELKAMLTKYILDEFENVNTEKELADQLRKGPTLLTIPGVVLEYLGLS